MKPDSKPNKLAEAKHHEMVKTIESVVVKLPHDINGNPRYYIPKYHLVDEKQRYFRPFNVRKYTGKKLADGWVLQSYNLKRCIERIVEEQFKVRFAK